MESFCLFLRALFAGKEVEVEDDDTNDDDGREEEEEEDMHVFLSSNSVLWLITNFSKTSSTVPIRIVKARSEMDTTRNDVLGAFDTSIEEHVSNSACFVGKKISPFKHDNTDTCDSDNSFVVWEMIMHACCTLT